MHRLQIKIICLSVLSSEVVLFPLQPVEEDVVPLFTGSKINFWLLKS